MAVKRREQLGDLPGKTILAATCDQLGVPFAGQNIPASYCVNIAEDKITVCGGKSVKSGRFWNRRSLAMSVAFSICWIQPGSIEVVAHPPHGGMQYKEVRQ